MKPSTRKDRSEVDIRVAQELKNNQDFIYQTNQSLHALREQIKTLSSQQEKVIAKCGSDTTGLFIEFENLIDSLLKNYAKLNQRMGEVEKNLNELLKTFTSLRDEVRLQYLTKEYFADMFSVPCNKIDSIEKELIQKNDYFNLAIHQLKGQVSNQIENVKKELTPVIPEVDPVQQKIDERFSVFKVDFDGLVREISLLKKAVAYDQKKFENVYTLIERLKEGTS